MTRLVVVVAIVAVLLLQALGGAQHGGAVSRSDVRSSTPCAAISRAPRMSRTSTEYKERRTELNLNPFGHLGTGSTRVVEVTPRS